MDETHLHFYTLKTGSDLLEMSGYEVTDQRSDGFFPLWKLRQLIPSKAQESLNRLACSLWPALLGFQHLYIARPLTVPGSPVQKGLASGLPSDHC